jgi:hypothetical protein
MAITRKFRTLLSRLPMRWLVIADSVVTLVFANQVLWPQEVHKNGHYDLTDPVAKDSIAERQHKTWSSRARRKPYDLPPFCYYLGDKKTTVW